MKDLLNYLKGKLKVIAVFFCFAFIFSISFALFRLPIAAVIYPFCLCFLAAVILLISDFIKTSAKLKELRNLQKLTAEMINALPADTLCETEYRELVYHLQREVITEKAAAQNEFKDMVDYYTVWAHQIKTPIASMKLTLQNEDSEISRKLSGELFHIEQYVNMVLAFLRLGSDSTDYVFKEYDLDSIIRTSVKKFAGEFIERKLSLNYTPANIPVITDEKWLSFTLEQLLSNALKYTKSGSVSVFADSENRLCIRDTGIGIASEDKPRIFEKGYTGVNGRLDSQASGLGLYLCRRVCENLNITISVESQIGTGTSVYLQFPENSLTKM